MKILLGLLLLISFSASAQLPDFTFNVAPTDETCAGNGYLTFTVSSTAPGATLEYSVYLQPDLEHPVYSGPNTIVVLPVGTYTVVAVETLSGETNIQRQTDVVIASVIADPIDFNVVSGTNSCGGANSSGEITIVVLSGNPVSYEVQIGSTIIGPQTSNVFTGLANGTYTVRAFNACGSNIPKTHTVQSNNAPPVISPPIFDDVITGNCNSVTIVNTFSYPDGVTIAYPLTVVYTIHHGDGSPDTVETDTYAAGTSPVISLSHPFTLVAGQTDTYDISVTNGCNITFPPRTGMVTAPTPKLTATRILIPCGQYYISLHAENFNTRYNIDFLDPVPNGFNPVDYNSGHPGWFYNQDIDYGSLGNAVPEGTYTIKLTDECNRTAQTTVTIANIIPTPVAQGINNGCFSTLGRIRASLPERIIVSASITSYTGTDPFPFPLPYNVTSFIDSNGILNVTNLPLGDYELEFTDNCQHHYVNIEATIPPFQPRDFEASTQADCTPGYGGVKVSSLNGNLATISITNGPNGYNNGVTPVDLSAYIASDGDLYVNNLIAGHYVFTGTDVCGIQKTVEIDVTGYQPSLGIPFTVQSNCNSFDVTLNDADTSSTSPTYWLQVKDPAVPDQWLDPATNAVYVPNTVPGAGSVRLTNNTTNFNLDYSGTFRIVKAFLSIGMGTATKLCTEVLGDEFDYFDSVTINGIYHLSCNASADDVYIDASGTAPLTYYIIKKDGQPFFVDNGTDNTFSNLAPGVYEFQVQNPCGQNPTVVRDITLLPDLVNATTPNDIVMCIEPGDPEEQEFDLSVRTAQILGLQSTDVYSVTYYDNRNDAVSGINTPLPNLYTNTSNPQTIYARVVNNFINVCPRIVSFKLWVSLNPQVTIAEQQYICSDQESLILAADPGYDRYEWITDEDITQVSASSIEIYGPGLYTVKVSNLYGSPPQPCETTVDIMIYAPAPPENVTIETSDWTEHDNVVTVIIADPDLYEYSLDNITYQESPVFEGLDAGIYKVYVRDKAHCATADFKAVLLNYPKYFTPNGDGVNETWRILYSLQEPDMMVYIYDRYGKLITNFDARSQGWDGTFNGNPLPSTDYWFVVNRQDGKIYKGHFSLVR